MQRSFCLICLAPALIFLTALARPARAAPKLPLIIAHRGASHDAPENTLAAFRLAWQRGADGIEADFFLSRDGHLVCIHDKDTKRLSGRKLIVNDTPLATLRQLDVGSWKDKKYADERIPTIAEVFATVPAGKKIFVELKEGAHIVAPLKQSIGKSGLKLEQIVIISFHEDAIAESKRQLPRIRAHWLHGYKQDETTGKWNTDFDQIVRTLKETKADGFGTQARQEVVTARFMDRLRKAGLQEFSVWTINEAPVANYFRAMNPVAITTDRPGYLRRALLSSSQPRPDP